MYTHNLFLTHHLFLTLPSLENTPRTTPTHFYTHLRLFSRTVLSPSGLPFVLPVFVLVVAVENIPGRRQKHTLRFAAGPARPVVLPATAHAPHCEKKQCLFSHDKKFLF